MLQAVKTKWKDLVEEHRRLEQVSSFLGEWLPPLNYITIHYGYFISIILASSLIFWGSSNPFRSVSYVDSLFMVTSALTNTGLNSRNLSELTTWQQVQIWWLLIIGSPIWISFWTVIVRRNAFENFFDEIVKKERERRKARRPGRLSRARGLRFRKNNAEPEAPSEHRVSGLGLKAPRERTSLAVEEEMHQLPSSRDMPHSVSQGLPTIWSEHSDSGSTATEVTGTHTNRNSAPGGHDHVSFAEPPTSPRSTARPVSSAYQPGYHLTVDPRRPSNATSNMTDGSDDLIDNFKKILGLHNTTRNGQFYDLSSDEREHIGGCEYRALKILSIIVPLYGFLWMFLGSVALALYISLRTPEIPAADGENTWWTGIFFAVSGFNNGGVGLINDSMIPFQSHYFVLFVIGMLILAGNTAYPVFLRLSLWICWKFLVFTKGDDAGDPWEETFEFILKFPRRVYTTLFPSRQTWWLVAVLFATNVIEWLAFLILNIGNKATDELPTGDRVIGGLFQAVSVRAAGFVVISVPSLYIGVQVLYLIMMYVSVYPVVITMRNSNVYEERSLGIYDDDPELKQREAEQGGTSFPLDPAISNGSKPPALRRRQTAAQVGKQALKRSATMAFNGVGARAPPGEEDTSRISFIGQQIRGQLAHDLWWLVAAVLVIVVIETSHFLADPVNHSVFNVLFECTSAYANVGLSLGLPTSSTSFAGGWRAGSKVLLCLVMVRGRHRGLPVAIDRAVRLPGDGLAKEEQEDSMIRRSKTMHRLVSRDGTRFSSSVC